jgi:hypothetical protein
VGGDAERPPGSLAEALSAIRDPRRRQRRVHSLVAVLQVSVAAMLCGARSIYAIGQWARERLVDAPGLLEALGVKKGLCPSVPTLHRVYKKMPAGEFEAALGGWFAAMGLEPGETIGIDGKTPRGIHGEEVAGVHLVSAYAVHAKAVIAQFACQGKGHELEGVRELIERLPLEGNLVVADALQCQRDICERIVERAGDYLLPVKENQPALLEDIRRAFSPSGA